MLGLLVTIVVVVTAYITSKVTVHSVENTPAAARSGGPKRSMVLPAGGEDSV
jgi:hypothetical protein